MPGINVGVASSALQLRQIVELQHRNHASVLPPALQAREGFVYAEYTLPLLARMSALLPQAVAIADDVVVGYCLALPLALRDELPALKPMFEQFKGCTFHGRPLARLKFFVGGQVCVERAYRGRGLLARLYDELRLRAPNTFELCVTEIAVRNRVSLRAHVRMGFETLCSYTGGGELWSIVAWDLARPAISK